MYETYVIKENDTIEGIANRFNTTPAILYQLNGYFTSLIPGNNIIVPKLQSPFFDYYTINKGDTLFSIAQNENIDVDLLARLNGLEKEDYIYSDQTIIIPKENVKAYITKENDTLASVTNDLQANLRDLLYQNSKLFLLPEQLIVYKEK